MSVCLCVLYVHFNGEQTPLNSVKFQKSDIKRGIKKITFNCHLDKTSLIHNRVHI